MNITQAILHSVEEGEGRIVIRLIPLVLLITVILLLYNFDFYRGLDDTQSMDNAQLARQISRGQGFTTEFIRPAAISQLHDYDTAQSVAHPQQSTDVFPPALFPKGTPRILPDTYNAPGYPYLLAGWFRLLHTNFVQSPLEIAGAHMYRGDRQIPWLNQIFLLLTAVLIFVMSHRLFDVRVAWMALMAFLASNAVWQYSITALSTSVLMFLVTILLFGATEIFAVGEACFESTEASFKGAWIWTLILGVVLGLTCLTRLHLVILLLPLGLFLVFIPRANPFLIVLLALIVIGMVTPWFWHMYQISGSPIGSNVPLLHYGSSEFSGNEIYCTLAAPDYERLFKDVSKKEYEGFLWHFDHAWELLGSNPLIVLFAASILHNFRRPRAQALRWLILGCAVLLVGVTSLCVNNPAAVGPWNTVVLLFPAMLVVGSAFFFILLDRLNLQLWLLNNAIAIVVVAVTAFPMVMTLTSRQASLYNYPPYIPAYIRAVAQVVAPDDWLTTDMPWATSWYGDRASLWLPDTVNDFEEIHDNYCPSDLLLLTPVILSEPATTLTSGEYKDWLPFIVGTALPAHFPLNARAPAASSGLEYIIWGDEARLQAR